MEQLIEYGAISCEIVCVGVVTDRGLGNALVIVSLTCF